MDASTKRQSALPRFGATKLPTSGIKPPGASSGIPAPRPTSIARAPAPSSWNASKAAAAAAPTTPRVRTNSNRSSNGTNTLPSSRPPSVLAGPGFRPHSTSYSSDSDHATGRNGYTDHTRNISSEGSEEGSTSTAHSGGGDISPIRKPKGRPSLSDRTIESLSKVPPSPAGDRRRSSVFGSNQTSPTTPRRPVSQIGGAYGAPKIGLSAPKGIPQGPVSPAKRPTTSYGTSTTPGRRSASYAAPRTAAQQSAISSLPRSGTPSAARRPSLAYPGGAAATPARTIGSVRQARPQSQAFVSGIRPPSPTKGRPASPTKARPASPTKARPASPTKIRPPSPTKISTTTAPAKTSAPDSEKENTAPSPSSSAALRAQIAQARAAVKAATKKEQEVRAALEEAKYDFENAEDPFNLKPKDGKDGLRKKLDEGRRDGKLNVSGMALKEIPYEVTKMYDAEAMEQSSVSWSECVDLVRFNAADNDLTEIGDNIFPDFSAEELGNDGTGSQFGGLEGLDLHGNRLMRIPAGLRQLSRLTSLNLSRNNLDNLAVDIITQISTLKELNLAHNSLHDELPESVGRLKQLEILDISSNRVNSLPKTMRDLLYLRSLQMSNNRLTSVPFDQLAVLPKLAEVAASGNALTGALFPSSVQTMATLRVLDVSDNAIASFNFSKVLTLPALVRIDVSRNRIGTFPDVSQWLELTTLVADENALSAFPRGMTTLKEKLRIVSLERNSLREIDEAVADMKALEQLNLASNPIRERKLLTMETGHVKEEMERKRQLASDLAAASSANTATPAATTT